MNGLKVQWGVISANLSDYKGKINFKISFGDINYSLSSICEGGYVAMDNELSSKSKTEITIIERSYNGNPFGSNRNTYYIAMGY